MIYISRDGSEGQMTNNRNFSHILKAGECFSIICFIQCILFYRKNRCKAIKFCPELEHVVQNIYGFDTGSHILVGTESFIVHQFTMRSRCKFSCLHHGCRIILREIFRRIQCFCHPSQGELRPHCVICLFHIRNLQP